MAKMNCKCGYILSTTQSPNDIQLRVFTDINDIVLRQVTWDRDIDMSYVKEMTAKQELNYDIGWSAIKMQLMFLSSSQTTKLSELINNLDFVIRNGILLNENPSPNASKDGTKSFGIMTKNERGL